MKMYVNILYSVRRPNLKIIVVIEDTIEMQTTIDNHSRCIKERNKCTQEENGSSLLLHISLGKLSGRKNGQHSLKCTCIYQ